jgi:hypothetical protein
MEHSDCIVFETLRARRWVEGFRLPIKGLHKKDLSSVCISGSCNIFLNPQHSRFHSTCQSRQTPENDKRIYLQLTFLTTNFPAIFEVLPLPR